MTSVVVSNQNPLSVNKLGIKSLSIFLKWNYLSRRTSIQMPPTRLRESLHPAVQSPATPTEPRRSGGEGKEQTLPLQHLWQRLRHWKQFANSYRQGQYWNFLVSSSSKKNNTFPVAKKLLYPIKESIRNVDSIKILDVLIFQCDLYPIQYCVLGVVFLKFIWLDSVLERKFLFGWYCKLG